MTITPDLDIIWQWNFVKFNSTILTTWIVMLILWGVSFWVSRSISSGIRAGRIQSALEVIVVFVREQITEATQEKAGSLLPFVGTIFVFVLLSNILGMIPGFDPPTGSLSTTTALAGFVFFAVPFYGIRGCLVLQDWHKINIFQPMNFVNNP